MSKQQNPNKTSYKKKFSIRRRNIILLVSLLSVITLSVGTTLAFIFTQTKEVKNVFAPTQVSCEVSEEFDGYIKENVKFKNTGSTDAYIRAAVIVTWVDNDGNIYAVEPQKDIDYTITFSDNLNDNWLIDKNGFYYCKALIAPNSETPQLIKECKVIEGKAPEDYHLSVEILASAIQSEPSSVVAEQWGVTVTDGNITGVPNV